MGAVASDAFDSEIQAHCNQITDNKRYKKFVSDARQARSKSRGMVNKLLDHAKKTGDKKAVTSL